jgi:Sulfatase
VRAEIDNELTAKSIAFIRRQQEAGKPFFLYLPFSMGHAPNLPSTEFKGKSRIGNYGDKLMEGDHHVGQILDALKELGVDDNTIVVFASDNGPYGETAREFGNQGRPTWAIGPQRQPGLFSASAPLAGYPLVYNVEMDPHENLVVGGLFGWTPGHDVRRLPHIRDLGDHGESFREVDASATGANNTSIGFVHCIRPVFAHKDRPRGPSNPAASLASTPSGGNVERNLAYTSPSPTAEW